MFLLMLLLSSSAGAQDTAQNLFSQYRDALYQIKIIDLESGNKSSIGSGFRINRDNLLVTNYHVVSDYVYFPEQYRIEYLDSKGNQGALTLFDFDVVNDLALVKFAEPPESGTQFALASALPSQGMPIYSLGNPHDLGMIVVPGTFNGLKNNSFYQRIHFTGSINPGMSGGPSVNQNGEVMGVNVATAGNQIGFLVPLQKIVSLLDVSQTALSQDQYKTRIQQQLHDNQVAMLSEFEQIQWKTARLGDALVPDEVVNFLSCWGDSNANDEEAYFLSVESRCRLDEQIYLNHGLRTGALEMEFEWLASDKLSSHRFYNFYSNSLLGAGPGNAAKKDDVTNFVCEKDLVTNRHSVTSKTVLCLRAYKDFEGLYDVLYIGASTDHQTAGLISHFTLSGVEKSLALKFTHKFMDTIQWH